MSKVSAAQGINNWRRRKGECIYKQESIYYYLTKNLGTSDLYIHLSLKFKKKKKSIFTYNDVVVNCLYIHLALITQDKKLKRMGKVENLENQPSILKQNSSIDAVQATKEKVAHCLKHGVGHFIAHPLLNAAIDCGEGGQKALANLALAKGT